jgi:hypothetical protein
VSVINSPFEGGRGMSNLNTRFGKAEKGLNVERQKGVED